MDFGTLDDEEVDQSAVNVVNVPEKSHAPPPSQSFPVSAARIIPLPPLPPPLPLPPLPLPFSSTSQAAPAVEEEENDDVFNAALDAIEAEKQEKNLKRGLEERQRKEQEEKQQQLQRQQLQQQQQQQQRQQQEQQQKQQQLRDSIKAREQEQEKQRRLAQEQEKLRRLAQEQEKIRHNLFDSSLKQHHSSTGMSAAAALLYEDVSAASTQQSVVPQSPMVVSQQRQFQQQFVRQADNNNQRILGGGGGDVGGGGGGGDVFKAISGTTVGAIIPNVNHGSLQRIIPSAPPPLLPPPPSQQLPLPSRPQIYPQHQVVPQPRAGMALNMPPQHQHPPQRLVLPPTATAPPHTPSQRITAVAAATATARDTAKNTPLNIDIDSDIGSTRKRKNSSNTTTNLSAVNRAPVPDALPTHHMAAQADLVAQGAPLWLATLGNSGYGTGGGHGDGDNREFKLNGAWLQMCLDLFIWPGLWQPLIDFRRGVAGCAIKSEEEFSEYTQDVPEGCSKDTVATLRIFNVDYIHHKQPSPAALPRLMNLVVRIVSIWPSSEVNDVAIVEDPTGQIAAVVLKKATEALTGDSLSPGAVILLQKVSVAVLGSCQTLVINFQSVLSSWGADTADPRRRYAAAAAQKSKMEMGNGDEFAEEEDEVGGAQEMSTSPSL